MPKARSAECQARTPEAPPPAGKAAGSLQEGRGEPCSPPSSGARGSGGPSAQAKWRTAASWPPERTATMGQTEEQSPRLLNPNHPTREGEVTSLILQASQVLDSAPSTQPTQDPSQLHLQKGMGLGPVTSPPRST